jgi:ribose 5-phosphate isomerase B
VVRKKNKIIVLASDHAGFRLKEIIKFFLLRKGKKVLDLGTKNTDRVDYPDYAKKLSKKINNKNNNFGILVCGSGIGMSIAANKNKNVRAALCYNEKSSIFSRKHNNANVITLGSRFIKKKMALKCIDLFINTKFDGGRHLKRVKKI